MAFYDDGMSGSPTFYAPSKVGGLRLGRVVNVYPLDLCVDVIYIDSYTPATSGTDKGKEGEFKVRVPVLTDMAGAVPEENWFSEETEWGKNLKNPLSGYGRVVLPRVGDYVVIGFINENYTAPVVLGCLHPRLRWLNVNGRTESPTDTQGPTECGVTAEPDRYITVYPSGLWTKVNQNGEVEVSFPLGKGSNEFAGFYLKVGRDDIVGEAKNLIDAVTKTKEKAEELKEASKILDIPAVQGIINQIKSGALPFEKGIDQVLANPEVRKVLSGDPDEEEDYDDGGCCCGAESRDPENPSSACSCGAGWATCPNCQTKFSGCPYKSRWQCPNCGQIVNNPNKVG